MTRKKIVAELLGHDRLLPSDRPVGATTAAPNGKRKSCERSLAMPRLPTRRADADSARLDRLGNPFEKGDSVKRENALSVRPETFRVI
jgi:hypothetical protein